MTKLILTLHSCLRAPAAYQEQSLCGGFCGYHHGTCEHILTISIALPLAHSVDSSSSHLSLYF